MNTPDFTSPPVVLTIAGSDNSAGAGIQADLKTFAHFGVYGLSAITCVVAEIPGKVESIQPVSPENVTAQILLCLENYPVAAIKTGMLYSTQILQAVVDALRERAVGIPLVVDPVMIATSGDSLVQESAIALYESALLPLATVVTPNLDEAAVLAGLVKITTVAQMEEAGRGLATRFGTPFLIKGGHLPGGSALDLLIQGDSVQRYPGTYIEGAATHGTGCTFSAAIAASLALGLPLPAAVAQAKSYISKAIQQSFRWQKNAPITALNHNAQR